MALSALAFHLSMPDQKECNKMIKKQAVTRDMEKALQTYIDLQEVGFLADNFTFPILLKAATELRDFRLGCALHCQTVKTGFSSHTFVQTALVNMYGNFGVVKDAYKVFESISQKDYTACNSMLDVYASSGELDRAMEFFQWMEFKDVASLNIMISGYARNGDVDAARALFDEAPVRDLLSWNAMIYAYTKVANMTEAHKLLDLMPEKDVITWNTMITGYANNDLYDEAVSMFYDMKAAGKVRPDHLTMAGVLSACSRLGSLEAGIELHVHALNQGVLTSTHVVSSLINMYANCGCIRSSVLVFHKSKLKDIYCWSSMISALGLHGYGNSALELFDEMRETHGLWPDDIAFIAVLSACSHSGLVEQGLDLFNKMESQFGLTPKSEHYSCMVDLLSRAGQLQTALRLIKTMPFEPGETVLGALLSACVNHQDLETGNQVSKLMQASCRQMSDGEFMMLSNLYATCGQWREADKWRSMMNNAGIVKTAGWSNVEVEGKAYKFLAKDPKFEHF